MDSPTCSRVQWNGRTVGYESPSQDRTVDSHVHSNISHSTMGSHWIDLDITQIFEIVFYLD